MGGWGGRSFTWQTRPLHQPAPIPAPGHPKPAPLTTGWTVSPEGVIEHRAQRMTDFSGHYAGWRLRPVA